ncbi:serine hydrolase domain-containing protein [Saccharopolyspora shandongensis]|uniref:serine hydrolase domain-containing protein n=1 Tax=Saccharopolyspora shandongensis TaxID=418495 RepID=UPI00341F9E79
MIIKALIASGAFAVAAAFAPPVGAADIDSVVEEYLRDSGLPGAAVAVTRGDEVVRAAGYGRTPAGEPITEHTTMAVASVSKSFTALAVVQLAEAGRVDLDEPVRRYLPEFTTADPRASRITVRQLLDQTSGLSDSTYPPFSRPQPDSLRAAVAGMNSAELAAEPGTRWEYHNPNFQVAARLVEVVAGRPFDDYLQEHVFAPLGMTDSRTIDTADELPPSGYGHLKVLGSAIAVPEPPAFGNGSGGVLSSAHDMSAWLIAQNNGGRGPGGVAIATASAIAVTHTPSSEVSGDYALGWSVGTTGSGAPVIAHSGDLFTSTAYQALLPASGYGIAVMANTGLAHGDAKAIADRLIALVEGAPSPVREDPLVVADVVFLVLTAGAALLAVRGVLRSRRWAAKRASAVRTAFRLLPLAIPLLAFAFVDRVVSVLYRGRDVAWIQVPYLYPTFMLLLATAAVGSLVVLSARIMRFAQAGRGK